MQKLLFAVVLFVLTFTACRRDPFPNADWDGCSVNYYTDSRENRDRLDLDYQNDTTRLHDRNAVLLYNDAIASQTSGRFRYDNMIQYEVLPSGRKQFVWYLDKYIEFMIEVYRSNSYSYASHARWTIEYRGGTRRDFGTLKVLYNNGEWVEYTNPTIVAHEESDYMYIKFDHTGSFADPNSVLEINKEWLQLNDAGRGCVSEEEVKEGIGVPFVEINWN